MLPVLLIPALVAVAPKVHSTPSYEVASEYVRELVELWDLQIRVDQEAKDDATFPDAQNRALMTSIRNSTRIILALKADIRALGRMHLAQKEHKETLPSMINFYQQKIQLHEELIQIVTALLVPKAGVDYGKLVAQVPQINATLGDLDSTLFKMTVLIFMSWIDMRADSQNHVNHLLLTKEQRDSLVDRIKSAFGASLETDKRYVVAEANLVKVKLLDFKCSDEPWE